MEAVERYTAKHGGDSFDAILEWPFTRFEAAYEAMCKRELEEELRQRKVHMTAALWSNGNLGGDDLNMAVEDLEENYDRAIRYIWGEEPEEEKIDWDDPFFAAAKRGMDKLDSVGSETLVPADATVGEVLPASAYENDQ